MTTESSHILHNGTLSEQYSSVSSPLVEPPRSKKAPQLLAAFIACLAPLSMGFVLGYSSPTLDYLIDAGILTKTEGSWFGSLVTVGAIVGGPVAASLVGYLGRKATLMVINLPYVVGWCILVFSDTYWFLFLGRLITGIAMGASSLAAPLYIAEIVSRDLRGLLGGAFQLFVVIGILMVYVLGMFLNYKWLAICGAVIPTVMVLAMIWAPETPRWYVTQRKRLDALASLRKLRGSQYDIEEECAEVEANIEGTHGARLSTRDLFQRGILHPIALSVGLMLFQQLSGVNAVIFYSKSIFVSAGFKSNPDIAAIILASVQVGATFLSCILMDVAGRRILLFIAGTFMSLSSIGFGLYYYLSDVKELSGLSWLSLVSLIVYITAFSLGWGPIPWLVMSEILPIKAMGVASGIATTVNWTCAFLVTKEFHDLQDALTEYGTFWGFGIICALGVIFVAIFIPETKGRSLEEIENHFGRNTSS